MDRIRAYLVSLVLLGATAYPVFLDPREDAFPFSTYPMFSRDRGAVVPVTSAVAVGGNHSVQIAPVYVANAEAMQAMQTLRKTVRRGKRSSRRLCRSIGKRIDASDPEELSQATHVELVTEKLHSVSFLAGEREALGRRVHARCRIPGRKKR